MMSIKVFKEELTLATDKQFQAIINIMLLKTIIPTTKELKNKAILNLKQYCMHCCMALRNIFYLFCVESHLLIHNFLSH